MLVIVDYKAGNLTSVKLAFAALGVEATVSADPATIGQAERVVFPGVGAAGAAMAELRKRGLAQAIVAAVNDGKPFLGICLGTQILLEFSEEDGGTDCLGLIPGRVKRFQPADRFDKIPQMGWNTVQFRSQKHPLFAGLEDESEFYFVHSYYPEPANPTDWLAETSYAGATFASVVGRDNLAATQFHPERSGRLGLKLLNNFSRWDGKC